MNRHYILENGLPKAVDLMTWAKWLETYPDRRVMCTEFPEIGVKVITVFLMGCDYEPREDGSIKIRLYGTLVRGGPMNEHEEQYFTREEAEDGHERLSKRVLAVSRGEIDPPSCCIKRKP